MLLGRSEADARPISKRYASTGHRGGRVLLASEAFPPLVGGSAMLFDGIYSRIDDAEVTVLAQTSGQRQEPPVGRMRIVRGDIAAPWAGFTSRAALLRQWRLAQSIRRLSAFPDAVVHCGRPLPEGLAALLARCRGGSPYVCWAHGEDLTMALTSREFTWLSRQVFRFAAAALANSCYTAEMLRRFAVPAQKIHVVYPGVDIETFRPDVDGCALRGRFAAAGDVVLLTVGRLQRRKGHDMAIRALAMLRGDLPHLRYVIVGDGEERARLEQLTRTLGVADRVLFAGTVSSTHLAAYYAACDIFVLPNRVEPGDVEGFGIVFLEAAAAGKPTIGGDSGGVPEAIEAGRTGLLVDAADAGHVAAAIRQLASSNEQRQAFGAAGRRRVCERFTWSRAAREVRDVQRLVLEHRRTR
jgi:phosphatidylinositol alpha-1,6-mannosyltransferase